MARPIGLHDALSAVSRVSIPVGEAAIILSRGPVWIAAYKLIPIDSANFPWCGVERQSHSPKDSIVHRADPFEDATRREAKDVQSVTD